MPAAKRFSLDARPRGDRRDPDLARACIERAQA
jgi:hypothetical protein